MKLSTLKYMYENFGHWDENKKLIVRRALNNKKVLIGYLADLENDNQLSTDGMYDQSIIDIQTQIKRLQEKNHHGEERSMF